MAPSLLRNTFRVAHQAMASSPRAGFRQSWVRAGQTGLYSTGKGAGQGDDDLLDAMMAGMDSDFK
ncbi:hypothetical protein BG006_007269, partial [Podila minutissima]